MFKIYKLKERIYLSVAVTGLAMFQVSDVPAGGGMVLQDDMCVIQIDFYSAHFTAYQPNSSGNKQFCQDLPATGETIFVFDYLHPSLKEVPVDFRIIRDVTGQGSYVKLKHVVEIGDLEQHTVFYQPPVVRPDDSFIVEYEITQDGAYIGIVTAGHPSTDAIYTAVFPFKVGGTNDGYILMLVLLLAALGVYIWRRVSASHQTIASQEAGL